VVKKQGIAAVAPVQQFACGTELVAVTATEMQAIGVQLAAAMRAGELPRNLLLVGEMGAGKTTLTQAIAAALGVHEPVTSPSYALLERYTLPNGESFVHGDLWRALDATSALADPELREVFTDPHAFVCLEWGESMTQQGVAVVEITVAEKKREILVKCLQ